MKGKRVLLFTTLLVLMAVSAWAIANNFQGFEANTGDWYAASGIVRTHSAGGLLHLPASSGNYYAELHNTDNGSGHAGFGVGGYTFYGGLDPVYRGDFYQSIDVFINANWAPGADPTHADFWIDMSPHPGSPDNYGAEHNFRLKATGSRVNVFADGQSAPIAGITASGWYTFMMTFHKAPNPGDPVITDMIILNAGEAVVGGTRVLANDPGNPFTPDKPFPSSNLLGNGWVQLLYWQNGFAGDVIGVDNVQTGSLPTQLHATGFIDNPTNPRAQDAAFYINAAVDSTGNPGGITLYEDKAARLSFAGSVTSITGNSPNSVTVSGVANLGHGDMAGYAMTVDFGANTFTVVVAAHGAVPAYFGTGNIEH